MSSISQRELGEFLPALARIAASYEPDGARRAELLEEIHLALASSLPRLHQASQLKPFIFRVAHNRAIGFMQRLARVPDRCDDSCEPRPFDAIRKLNLPHRQAMLLLLENFCETEIADVLCIPPGRVRARIDGAIQQLAVRFDEMRGSWCQLNAEVSPAGAWLRLRSRWTNPLICLVLACAAAGTLAGIWLAYSAWRLALPPTGAAAVVLLLLSPALAGAAYLARKENLDWQSESPESVLVAGRYRAEASLRAIRLGRGYVCVIASHIAILWVSELGGLISASESLTFYSGAWTVMAVLYLPWLAHRETRVYEERAITLRLLGEVTSADG